jgi:hypothetical protein
LPASGGTVTFQGIVLTKAGSGYTLVATSGNLAEGATTSITINPGAATQVAIFTQPPATVAAGQVFGMVVQAQDQYGNLDPTYTNTITLNLSTSVQGAMLGGTVMMNASAGVATFSDLTLDKPGMGDIITVSGQNLAGTAPTNPLTVNVGAPAMLLVTSPPAASYTSDAPISLAVTVTDSAGNKTAGFTGPVTLSIGNNAGGSTLSPVTVNASGGVATFNGILLNKAGNGYTLRITSGTLTLAIAGPFNITPGAVTQLAVTSPPPGVVTAGQTFSVSVSPEDVNDNVVTTFSGSVTVTLATNPGGATAQLGGTPSEPVINGVATFPDLTLNKAANGYQIQAFSGNLTVPTSTINVIPAPAAQLVVIAQPTPATVKAGSPIGGAAGFQVAAEDNNGNVDPNFHGTIDLSILNPGGANLGGSTSATPLNGVATFSGATLDKATPAGGLGYTLVASSGSLKTGSTNAIIVVPGTATKLLVTAQPPANDTIGNSFPVKVSAVDSFGNVDPTFTGTVSLGLQNNPSGATLGGTTTATAANGGLVAGVATFPAVTLSAIGSGETLQATATGLASVTTNAFAIQPASAIKLIATTVPPASLVAGTPFDVVIKAVDSFGDVDPNFNGSVTLAVLPSGGGTPVFTQMVNAASGVATFPPITLTTAASGLTIQVSSPTLPTITTAPFTIVGGHASMLLVKTQPATTGAGSPFSLVVTAVDGYDNPDPTFSGTVTVNLGTGAPAGTVLTGTKSVAAFQGVATFFGLSLNRAATSDTLQLSATGLTSVNSAPIAVTPATAAQIMLTQAPPSSATAGTPFGFSVAIADADGNLVTSYNGEVTVGFLSNAGGAGSVLSGTLTVPVSGGTATFSGLALDRAASGYQLQVASGSLVPASTGTINVTPAAAAQLVLTTPPPGAVNANAGFGVAVTVEDAFGNVVPGFAGTVILSIHSSPSGGALSGTTTAVAQSGVASFPSVSLNAAANGAVLQAAATGLTPGVTGAITVIAPPATVQSVAVVTQHITKVKTAKVISVQFGSGVDPNAAVSLGNYSLVTVANGKKHPSKAVALGHAVYNAATHQVTLTTKKPLVLTTPLHLAINVTGQTFLATLTKGGTSVSSTVPLQPALAKVQPVEAAHVLDALLHHGFRPRFRHLSQ